MCSRETSPHGSVQQKRSLISQDDPETMSPATIPGFAGNHPAYSLARSVPGQAPDGLRSVSGPAPETRWARILFGMAPRRPPDKDLLLVFATVHRQGKPCPHTSFALCFLLMRHTFEHFLTWFDQVSVLNALRTRCSPPGRFPKQGTRTYTDTNFQQKNEIQMRATIRNSPGLSPGNPRGKPRQSPDGFLIVSR